MNSFNSQFSLIETHLSESNTSLRSVLAQRRVVVLMGLTNERFNDILQAFNDLILLSTYDLRGVGVEIVGNYLKFASSGKGYTKTRLQVGSSGSTMVQVDFSICYDEFYQVPRLFFRVSTEDGLLTMDNCPSVLGVRKETGIIYDMHIVTNEPWYTIHPCEMYTFMEEMLGPEVDDLSYLKSWFGVYGIGAVFSNVGYRPGIDTAKTE